MPSVPMYNRPTVAPTPRRAITVPAAAEGATLAASALGTAAEAFQKERERAGRIRADAAEAEIRGIGSRLGDEVSRMQRTQAFGAEEMVAERWDTETAKVLSQITDPEVRSAVQRRSDILRSELVERARRHGLNQQDVVAAEAYTRNQKDDLNALRTTPLSDAEAVVERIGLRAADRARTQGMDSEAMQAEVATARSKARLMQVNALVDTEQTDQAAAFLQREGVLADMTPEDLTTAKKLVEVESRAMRAQRGRDVILAEYTDERAALKAVRDRFSGQEEDDIAVRVRQYFADQRRQGIERRESLVETATNAIVANNGDMSKIPANVARALQTQHAATWKNLQMFALQTATGAPLQSDTEWLQKAGELTPESLLTLDLTAYQSHLSAADFQDLQERQQKARRGEGVRGMTRPEIADFAFNVMLENGMFIANPKNVAGVKVNSADNAMFTQVRSAIDEAIAVEREAKGNRGLTGREIQEVIRGVLDDRVLRTTGRNRIVPRAGIAPNMEFRPLSAADSARIAPIRTARRVPPLSSGMSRAARWEQLVDAGFSEAEATATVNRELPR